MKLAFDHDIKELTYRDFGDNMRARDDTWGSCEVSCCAWAVFKICNYLLKFTGKAKYGDWVERMLYNGTGGQLPVAPGGKIMYYASYFVNGAVKSAEDRRFFPTGESFHWQCCTGTWPQDVAFDLHPKVPSWLKGPLNAKLNGEDIALEAVPNTWCTISRKWSDGDVIMVTFPFTLWFEPVDPDHPEIVALCYGPIVLVGMVLHVQPSKETSACHG